MTDTIDTWQSVADIAQSFLGDPTVGCQFCGVVVERVHEVTGQSAYHPGVECCPGALKRQIKWRTGDVNDVQRRITDREKGIEQMQAEQETALSRSAAAAIEARVAKARVALDHALKEIFTPQLQELSGELSRLRQALRIAEGHEVRQAYRD